MANDRIDLKRLSPRDWLALFESAAAFADSFGLPPARGLRELFVSEDLSDDWVAALRDATRADPWTHGFAVVLRDTREVIGTLGFKGAPDAAGRAEIAYAIVPERENQGFATEAVALGSKFAFSQGVVRLVAHTMPARSASTRVLEKSGFDKVGAFDDPDDGPVWRWERTLEPAQLRVGDH